MMKAEWLECAQGLEAADSGILQGFRVDLSLKLAVQRFLVGVLVQLQCSVHLAREGLFAIY